MLENHLSQGVLEQQERVPEPARWADELLAGVCLYHLVAEIHLAEQ